MGEEFRKHSTECSDPYRIHVQDGFFTRLMSLCSVSSLSSHASHFPGHVPIAFLAWQSQGRQLLSPELVGKGTGLSIS